MRVVSKTEATDHVFSAISKEEVGPISSFLQSKNVKLKNEMDEVMEVDPISDEDDDMESIPSDDDDDRGKKGKNKEKVKKPAADDDSESGEL
jgi:structure-specific recognition protein 1